MRFHWPPAMSGLDVSYHLQGLGGIVNLTSTTTADVSRLTPGSWYTFTLTATVDGGATSLPVLCANSTGIYRTIAKTIICASSSIAWIQFTSEFEDFYYKESLISTSVN